jgi:O-antigen/teichoic acid export membrane protein
MQLDADKSILARSVSSAAAGIYTAAFRLVFMACMPIFAIVVAIQARMFRRGREEGLAGTLKAVRPLMAYAAGYCVLLALAIYLLAPVVPSLLGASYEGSVEVVRLLCLLPFFLTIQSITAEALTGADSQRLLGALYALAAAMALVLNLVLVPRFGWSGAVMAAYGSQAFLLAGMFATILVLLRPRRIASESRP